MTTTRSAVRRPRRPGDARHDPDAPDVDELLDDHRLIRGNKVNETASPAPVVCAQVLLLRARVDCPECGGRTPVYAMLGSPEFDTDDRPTTMLRRISELPTELDKAVRAFAKGRWRRDRSERVRGVHWHSHCQHCNARLGEAFVLGPSGPFRPTLYKERRAIGSEAVQGPIVLAGAQRAINEEMLGWLDWTRSRHRKAAAGLGTRGLSRSG